MRFKMTAAILGAMMLVASTSWADSNPSQFTWNFDSPTGPLGVSQTYTVSGGPTLTAYGFASPGTPTDLFGKNAGSDQQGLGINGLPQNEIGGTAFVQLDVAPIMSFGTGELTIASVQTGESYDIWISNTLGVLGTEIIANGTLNNIPFSVPLTQGTYLGISAGSGNVLVNSISVSSTPEPGSLVLFGTGLLLAGLLFRRYGSTLARIES